MIAAAFSLPAFRYYFVARRGQPFNRIVDISSTIEKKINSGVECKSQGRGNSGSKLRARPAKQGKRLTILGNYNKTADSEYVGQFLIIPYRRLGEKYREKNTGLCMPNVSITLMRKDPLENLK